MDASQFDLLTRSLTAAGTRRRAMGGLLLGSLGLLGWASAEDASAHNTLKRCKKIEDKTKRKKCVKKAKKHNAQHAADTVQECGRPEDCAAPQGPCRVATCSEGRCAIVHPSGGNITCGIGACQRTVTRCINGEQQQCVPGAPSSEICNGIDDDCDGSIDEDAPCPVGQRCERGGCCKVEGFGTEHECTNNTECCSGNCVATFSGTTTCRPVGCLPTGGDCSAAGSAVCCSFTCSGGRCQ